MLTLRVAIEALHFPSNPYARRVEASNGLSATEGSVKRMSVLTASAAARKCPSLISGPEAHSFEHRNRICRDGRKWTETR